MLLMIRIKAEFKFKKTAFLCKIKIEDSDIILVESCHVGRY